MARPADPHLRSRLLDASSYEFARHGFAGASVEAITKRAGYSKAAFYLHFETKEDVFRELVSSFLGPLDELLAAELPGLRELPDTQALIDAMVAQHVVIFEHLWKHRQLARLVLDGGMSAEFQRSRDALFKRGRSGYTKLLGWAVRRGFFRSDLELERAGSVCSAAFERLAREVVFSARKPVLTALVRGTLCVLMNGALPNAPPNRTPPRKTSRLA